MRCADATCVPAGGALAVDREAFSRMVTDCIRSHPNIEIVEKEILSPLFEENAVIASGPLTSDGLSESIREFFGVDALHFCPKHFLLPATEKAMPITSTAP